MKKSVRNSRIVQLVGAAFLVMFVVSCSQMANGTSNSPGSIWLLLGLVMVIGARIYEWLSKE